MAESRPRRRRKSPNAGSEADLFGQVVRAVNVAYYVWDVAAGDVRISAAFAELFGYDPSVMNAEFYRNFFHADDLPAYRAAIQTAFRGDADRVETTYRMRSGSGAYLWTHDQAVLERDADGRVTRVVGAVSDITREHEREAALRQSLEFQTAQSDVLRVISRASFDLQPVLKTLLESATRLCAADYAMISIRDGDGYRCVATYSGLPEFDAAYLGRLFPVDRGNLTGRTALEARAIHFEDMLADADITVRDGIKIGGGRTALGVPLLRDGEVVGVIGLARRRVEPYTERQIDLVRNFADQAVIAMENARLLTEQREALERQTATLDILQTINASLGDLPPVFDAVLDKALQLCGAAFGIFWQTEGEHARAVTLRNVPPALADYYGERSHYAGPQSMVGRAIHSRQPVQVADARADEGYVNGDPLRRASVDLGNIRTLMGVPLVRNDRVLGVLAVFRQEVRPFSDQQIALVQNFAAQAVIAMENARLITEQREALEQQTAQAEVLRVVSRSTFDLQAALEAVLAAAARLCEVDIGSITVREGDHFRTAATFQWPEYDDVARARGRVIGIDRGSLTGRVALAGQVVQITDATTDPEFKMVEAITRGGVVTGVGAPLLREGRVIGTINLGRKQARPFSDRQIELLGNFADQAVIAVENTRLITEQREALERQTATAEVLEVINSHPGDLTPVFDAVLRNAMHLCDAAFGEMHTWDGENFSIAAHRGIPTAFAAYREANPAQLNAASIAGRMSRGENVIRVPDLKDTDLYREGHRDRCAAVDIGGARSAVIVALRKDSSLLGIINIYRQEVKPFDEHEVSILQNFAAQVVIAMENARLITEQTEALARQTATAEVLEVINKSPGNLAPVFDAILEKGLRLIDAAFGTLWINEGENLRAAATRGMTSALARFRTENPVVGTSPTSRQAYETRRSVQQLDNRESEGYRAGLPGPRAVVNLGGARTMLVVPLLTENAAIGCIQVYRQEVRAFTEQQIALMENFAAQAVIAMENARLITEQREALERQTATTEVLGVINASPGNLTPVFEAMLDKAINLCAASFGVMWTYDGSTYHPAVLHRVPEKFAEFLGGALQFSGTGTFARLMAGSDVEHVADIGNTTLYRDGLSPIRKAFVEIAKAGAVLLVALRTNEKLLGAFQIYKTETEPFTDKQIDLVRSFAAQAVIAMENARLITEQTEALERQTATSELLGIINSSFGDLAPVFDAMLANAMRLCDATCGGLFAYDGTGFQTLATRDVPAPFAEYRQQNPPTTLEARSAAVLEARAPVHVLDISETDGYKQGDPSERAIVDLGGARTILNVPLLKRGQVVGYISVYRGVVRAFSDRQIALLENFAAQAVIAMENARLITEQREALDRQTAMAQILAAINASPNDPRPVFEEILDKAHALCGATLGQLMSYDGNAVRIIASRGMPAEYDELMAEPFQPGSSMQALIAGERYGQIVGIEQFPMDGMPFAWRTWVEFLGEGTYLGVPLRLEERVLGFISAFRSEHRAFSENEIALLENFAAQAVIAMENARLITEQREALERQTATAEVLEVINSSPGNLQPVFQTMLDRALHLCGASFGEFLTYDGEEFHFQAGHNVPPAFTEWRRQHGAGPAGEALRNGMDILNVPDLVDTEIYRGGDAVRRGFVEHSGARSAVAVALRKEGRFLGMMGVFRQEVKPFDERQVSILQNFAAQAVIAMENARLLEEQREALEQQTATAEVLSVINANPGDLEPVFDTLLEKACALCDADSGGLWSVKDGMVHTPVTRGFHPTIREYLSTPRQVDRNTGIGRLMHGEQIAHIADLTLGPAYLSGDPLHRLAVDVGGIRSLIAVPLKKDGVLFGAFGLTRHRTQAFSDKHISLLQNFAAQAVIAMENARLLDELRQQTEALAQRNTEFGERIEQQSATIDVLKVMSGSPGDPAPVFDMIARQAQELCNGDGVRLAEYDGQLVHLRTLYGADPAAKAAYKAAFPITPTRGSALCRAILDRRTTYIRNMDTEPGVFLIGKNLGMKAVLAVPLLRDGNAIGAISIGSSAYNGFTDSHIALLQTFAEQAVIAITSAETYNELQDRTAALARRNSEYSERIEQQSATIDVLQVMSSSPGDPQPVFALIVERARAFCHAEFAGMALVENDTLVARAHSSANEAGRLEYERGFPRPLNSDTTVGRAVLARDIVQIADLHADPNYVLKGMSAARATMAVPMLRAGNAIGAIVLGRSVPGAFSETQMELLRTFAEQAVIAITSAETYNELQERTAALARRNSEFGERIEQQSATIDVLKVMSSTPSDTRPIFDLIAQKARELCNTPVSGLFEYDGDLLHARSVIGFETGVLTEYLALFPMRPDRGSITCRAILDRTLLHIRDVEEAGDLLPAVRRLGYRSQAAVPMNRDGRILGVITIASPTPGGFSDSQIALLQTFAEQAVIAITSAENYRALTERTEELARSVNELQALEETIRAVNSSLDLGTVLSTIIDHAVQLSQADEGTIYEFDEAEQVFVPKAAFGMSSERIEALRLRKVRLGETHLGRAALQRAPVHVSDVQQDRSISGVSEILAGIHAVLAVPLLREEKVIGGLVIRRRTVGDFAPTIPTLLQTFAGQSVLAIENARLFQQLGERGEDARRAREAAEAALANLRRAQDRLVQSEKMASLGQLTAGVAHEIKNPLNFVNNFADLSVDLLDELNEVVAPGKVDVAADLRAEIDELTDMLKGNLAKIAEHGRRADSIVKNMLLHARSGSGEQRPADVNALAEEALNLAYHGARAETPGFDITMERDFDPDVGEAELLPQEFTRVLVNLINNGFYAARKRGTTAPNGYEPTLRLSTRNLGDQVEIHVRDNGTGIPTEVREKIFEPFFTTKPAGEGTGLGLSLSYDIIVKQHGGQLTVDSEPGSFTEFRITLPRHAAAATTGAGGRA